MQYISCDGRRDSIWNAGDSVEALYPLDNDFDGGNVFCGAVQDIQKNCFMVCMAEMRDGKCSDNPDRAYCRVYLQYQNAYESMGLFRTAFEFSRSDMPVIQCIMGSADIAYTCVVRFYQQKARTLKESDFFVIYKKVLEDMEKK